MAHAPTSSTPPLTEEAFLADRQSFFNSFAHFTTGSVIAIVILLILMAFFLL